MSVSLMSVFGGQIGFAVGVSGATVVVGAQDASNAGRAYVFAKTVGTVSMINTRTCNAYRQRGCTSAPPTVTVGAFPAGIAVNPRTHTVYVANDGSGKTGTVTVLADRTCNAATTSGCAQAPHTVTVGFSALALAVNTRTDTIYVANFAHKHTPFAGNTVSVIDGTTCNAADTTGCGNTPKTITLGPAFTTPIGVAVDQAADTIYIADLQNGEGSGTVSVINGATCNAATTTGCGHTPPTVTVGFGPSAIAFDPANHTVAVTSIKDTSVSVINAATCNAATTVSCHGAQPKLPVGRAPSAVAIDPAARTMYIANGDNTVSAIPEAIGRTHMRCSGACRLEARPGRDTCPPIALLHTDREVQGQGGCGRAPVSPSRSPPLRQYLGRCHRRIHEGTDGPHGACQLCRRAAVPARDR